MNLFASIMRTLTPVVAGLVLSLAARVGLDLDGAEVTAAVTAALTAGYYTAWRLVEEWAGRLGAGWARTLAGVALGWARPPEYPRPDGLSAELSRYAVRDGGGGRP